MRSGLRWVTLPLLLISSLNAWPQTPDTAVLLSAARTMMERAGTCALITVDKGKQARVRTMDPFPPEAGFTVWLATNPQSRKVDQIRRNPRVTLYYSDGDNGYVSLTGSARLVNDPWEKAKRWKEEWTSFYPDREGSYLLIEVRPLRLEIIDYRNGISGNPLTWEPASVVFSPR